MPALRSLAALFARTPLHPQWLLGRRKPPPGLENASGNVLDIGAADRWARHHLKGAVEYVALDFPMTGQTLYDARPDVYADGAALPFGDESFDVVLCLEVLEHVQDPSKVVSEIARVLKSGGYAYISMPFLYPLHDAPFDFQRYTEYGIRRDVEMAGLEVETLWKSLHAAANAGLLACLAVAGPLRERRGWGLWLRLPVAAALVLCINVAAWVFSCLWPDWGHLAVGHETRVRKP